ncbi:hypothetical protein Tco_1262535 [Tanacetum coccineum]
MLATPSLATLCKSHHEIWCSIAASLPVPWIYLGQFWHTLKEDGSKYRLNFVLERKEPTLTLDDFRRIFQLPQATDKNHECFVAAPKFLEMVSFFLNDLGFTLELRSLSNFKTNGKNKAGIGMKIPTWFIIDEMKLTKNYQMYAKAFRVDVPTTQSQPIESTQGTRRTPRTPRTPNPDVNEGELNMIVQDTIQLSIVEQKIRDDLEAEQNVEKVKDHLAAEEIQKMVEGTENVEEDEFVNSVLNSQNDPYTRLDPKSYKESLEVEKVVIVQLVNVIKEEDKSAEDDYELRRRVKGNHVEESSNTPSPTKIRSLRIHSILISSDTKKLQELTVNDPKPSSSIKPSYSLQPKTGSFKWYKSFFKQIKGRYGYLFGYLNISFMPRKSFHELAIYLQEVIQANESKPGPSTLGNQEQLDDFNFWMDKYATYDDELPAEKVSQEVAEEMSKIVDEAKLRKVVDEMLRQRCTSGDEHQYHIYQMQNFLKNDIVWESKKEILTLPFPLKPTPIVQSCQRDPKAPALSLVNQDLLYLKKGNSRLEKCVLSLYKFPAVIFPDDDIEERTSRWVDKCVKKFNPYARYSVEH